MLSSEGDLLWTVAFNHLQKLSLSRSSFQFLHFPAFFQKKYVKFKIKVDEHKYGFPSMHCF